MMISPAIKNILWIGLALWLAACTREEAVGSIGKSLQGACRNNPDKCTVYDEDGRRQ
jgi:hypothetical protein